ncbi:MAG: WG repeat-containing protein [Mariniphaga sp.]|nr:WG repeat-containing protein [Mariniphaga sp.]
MTAMNDEYESKRTIEEVLDMETGEYVSAKEFFKQPESVVMHYRRLQEEAIQFHQKTRFVCSNCQQNVKISGKATKRGQVSYFAHLYDSDDCEIKTSNNLSKEDIEREKFLLLKESERHINLKNKIYCALTDEGSVSKGITNVVVEKRFVSKNPLLNWRQPDVYAEFNGKKVVFELQLSTTFLSVIVARDIFYQLNDTFIIWVFNFQANQQFVNFNNLMCKDIYYANRRNAFIFDEEAQWRSEQEKELVLLCVWFEPLIKNGNYIADSGIRKEKYIKFSELNFDPKDYKPYYVDADALFLKYEPEQLARRQIFEKQERLRIEDYILKARETEEINKAIQNSIDNGGDPPQPIEIKGKWGYTFDGKIVVEPKYTEAHAFDSNLLAKVKRNKKYGFINIFGEEVIPCQYLEVFEYFDNKCVVRRGKEWLQIDNSNNILKEYESVDKISVIDSEHKLLLTEYRSGRFRECGVLSLSGEEKVANSYWLISASNNNALVAWKEKDDHLYHHSPAILPLKYDFIGELVCERIKVRQEGKWGYINEKGVEVINCQFDEVGNLIGEANVRLNSKWGRIDEHGKWIFPCIYDNIFSLRTYGYDKTVHNDNFQVTLNGLSGIVSKTGEEVIPIIYNYLGSFKNGVAKVNINEKWGYINEAGETFIPIVFNRVIALRGLADDSRYLGIEHTLEKEKIKDKQNVLRHFSVSDMSGYLHIYDCPDGFVGIINNKDETEEYIFDSYNCFKNGRAIAHKNGFCGVVDMELNSIVDFRYDDIKPLTEEGFLKAKKKSLWGIVDYNGKEIVPHTYDEINNFNDEFLLVKKDGCLGTISTNFEEVISPIYQSISRNKTGLLKVQLSDFFGYIDLKNNIIIQPKYKWISDNFDETITIKLRDGSNREISGLAKYVIIINGYQERRGYVNIKGKEYWQYWKDDLYYRGNRNRW